MIQNTQSQLSQACCALQANRRWAITGTPIQNKLLDFASIVRFLQVHPYSDQRSFDEDIIKPWKDQRDGGTTGFLRLKALVRAITISRTKAVVLLPPREDEIHRLEFTPAERQVYETVKAEYKANLDEAICAGNQGKTINVLALLNQLRLICNHGILTHQVNKENSRYKSHRSPPKTPLGNVWRSCNTLLKSCSNCGVNLMNDILESGLADCSQFEQKASDSNQELCHLCVNEMGDGFDGLSVRSNWSGRSPTRSPTPTTPRIDIQPNLDVDTMSTKIKALNADIYKHYKDEKR